MLPYTFGHPEILGTGIGGFAITPTPEGNHSLIAATAYVGGWKRLIYRYVGESKWSNLNAITPAGFYKRMPTIWTRTRRLVKEIFEGGQANYTARDSRFEIEFAGWTFDESKSNLTEFCRDLEVDVFECDEPPHGHAIWKLFDCLGINMFAVPLDNMIVSVHQSLTELHQMVCKFVRLANSNGTPRKRPFLDKEQHSEFTQMLVAFKAEIGLRQPGDRGHEHKIDTDPAAHEIFTWDLMSNYAFMETPCTDVFGSKISGISLIPKTLHDVTTCQKVKNGTTNPSCPKCGHGFSVSRAEFKRAAEQQISVHIKECKGTSMGEPPTAVFKVTQSAGETLEEIADLLQVNVYVLLALNLDKDPAQSPCITILDRFGTGTEFKVPLSSKAEENINIKGGQRRRDETGKFLEGYLKLDESQKIIRKRPARRNFTPAWSTGDSHQDAG